MTHRLLGNDGRYVQNAELLRKVQLEWPRRAWRKIWRAVFILPIVWVRLGIWHALWNVARGATSLLARLASRANAGMQRAWNVIDPRGFPGVAENYVAQRKYDSLAAWYATIPPNRRNAMVADLVALRTQPPTLHAAATCMVHQVYPVLKEEGPSHD